MNPQDTNPAPFGQPTPTPNMMPPTGQPVGQPGPTPQPPVYASGPMFAGASQKSSKRLFFIIGGSIVAVVIALGVAGYFAYTKLMGVSKDDYNKTYHAALSTQETFDALESTHVLSSVSTSTELSNNVDTAKKKLDAFVKASDALKGQKALHDSKINATYKTYSDQEQKYVAYLNAYISSANSVMQPALACEKSVTGVTNASIMSTKLQGCITDFKAVQNVADPDIRALLNALLNSYTSLNDLMNQMSALSPSDYTTYYSLSSKQYTIEATLNTAIEDAGSNSDKHHADVSPEKQLQALIDQLSAAYLKK